MSKHFNVYCREHGVRIGGCRCSALDKERRLADCPGESCPGRGGQPVATPTEGAATERERVKELLREMVERALCNAPVRPEEEAAYEQLYEAYTDRLLNARSPAPASPAVGSERLREALGEALDHAIVKNGERYAYDRCRICGCTWWGEREGRTRVEPERHNLGCAVPRWRAALAAPPQEQEGRDG